MLGRLNAVHREQKSEVKFANNINQPGWETLEQRRLIARICALFKAYTRGRAWKAIGDTRWYPKYSGLVPPTIQRFWYREAPVDGRTTMSSEFVCQVSRSWVEVGSFQKHLFGVVYVTCGDFHDGSEKETASVQQHVDAVSGETHDLILRVSIPLCLY